MAEYEPSEEDRPQADWIPEEALRNLASEQEVHPDETPEQIARRLFRENMPVVAQGIVHTALWGSTDRVRLDAQKYITERVMGRVGDDAFEGSNPTEDLIGEVTKYVSEHAAE